MTRQREDCLALVEAQGWQLTEVYQDNDISASTGAPRPAYDRLLRDIRAGLIDALVAWHPDRLYRKVRTLEDLLDAIEKQNILLRTVRAGELDLSTPTGRMLARVVSAIAQGEGEVKADRWSRSWRQGRENGDVARTGSRLFGYTREGEIVDHEAKVGRRMADDVVSGVPILAVARWLGEEGVRTTRGSVWRTSTVRQYLANPRIAGYSTLHDEIVAEGQWEPLIDRDTWETIRALLQSRSRGTVPRTSVLNGLIYCGACGHRLITGKDRTKRTYRCPNRPGMPGCGKVSGLADPIEEIVETYTQVRLSDPAVRLAVQRLSTTGAPSALAEIANLEARISELEVSLDEPGVPVATIVRAIDRTRQRLEEAQSKLLDARPVPLPTSGGDWPTDLERRRRLIDVAVARVDLMPTAVHRKFDPERVKITPR